MKTIILGISTLIMGVMLHAQNDLTLFSEDGKPFFLTVNGMPQNTDALARVTAYDIKDGGAAILVRFADGSAPDISQRISFLDPDTDVSYMITLTKKGYKIRYFGEAARQTQQTQVISEKQVQQEFVKSEPIREPMTTTTVETVTMNVEQTEGMNPHAETESVTMNVGIAGFNMNVDVKVSEGGMSTDQQITQTTTTTTTTVVNEPAVIPVQEVHVIEESRACAGAPGDQQSIIAVLKNESFEDDRLDIAENAMAQRCFKVAQISELAQQFTFEENRLTFVKRAYERCVDPENYYQLNSIFTFSASKEELNSFIKEQR